MRFTVRTKLALGFGILIILLGITSTSSILNLASTNEDLKFIYERDLKGIEYIKDAEISLLAISRARNNAIISTDISVKKEHINRIQEYFIQFESNFGAFQQTLSTDETRAIAAEIIEAWPELKANETEISNLVINNDLSGAVAKIAECRAATDAIESNVNKLVEIKSQQAQAAYHAGNESYLRARTITVSIGILSLLVSMGIVWVMSTIIAKPIIKIANGAEQIANGHLNIEKIEIKNKDEIYDLAQSFNKMAENLRKTIVEVLDISEQVAASSEELSATSEEVTATVEQVTETIHEFTTGMTRQAEDVTEASSGVNEMVSSIEDIAQNTKAVADTSKAVSKEAMDGLNESKLAIETIERIKNVTEQSAETANRLGSESARIGEIVEVIRGIADQTNLLALNAAIEAARAGEQGKGFAVVADEVRKLAEQSSTSAIQISELIDSVQQKTNEVVAAMDTTNHEVSNGVIAVNKAGKYFEEIYKDILNVEEKVSQVSETAQQIVNHGKTVNHSVESIAAITQEAAASSEEISASTEEQSSAMVEVANSANDLARMAEDLQVSISIFKM